METVLLAAGSSSRMGTPKLLLPYKGKPLVVHALESALSASERVILVTGTYHEQVEQAVSSMDGRLVIVRNERPQRGQFSSVQTGVSLVSEGSDFAIALADNPLILPAHYRILSGLLEDYEAVRPYCQDIPGHPVLCRASLRETILSLPITTTMHVFLSERVVRVYNDIDVAWICDIDTPEDYQLLMRQEKQPPFQ